jgi:flagellar basal-body rod protein FlgF
MRIAQQLTVQTARPRERSGGHSGGPNMFSGLYASASSLFNGQKAVDVLASNLANIQVPGYKEQRPVYRSFPDLMLRVAQAADSNPKEIGKTGGGAFVQDIYTSFENGQLTHTGNRDDLAISGNGFFQVLTERGVRLTRNGSFERDPQGILRNANEEPVLGKNGFIHIPEPVYTVKEDGQICIIEQRGDVREEVPIDQLDIVDVENKAHLRREGNSQFSLPEGISDTPVQANGRVQQGYLEQANLTVVDAMIQMIDAFRSYEMSQRMLKAVDETLDKVVNEVAATA